MDGASAKKMTVWGAAFLGVGSMVGAGVFALLGEAGAVAGAAVWLSFLLGGIIAALLGYVVVKLGARYPSSGGLVSYLFEGFGPGRLAGATTWLYYFAALIVTAMVSVSFGNYGASLFWGENATPLQVRLLASGVIVAMVAVALLGAKFIGRVQSVIVIVLLAVFAVFIVATLSQFQPALLAPSGYPPARSIVSSIALTFFAFLGFAVISFTTGDLRNPEKDLPKAMALAIGLTTALYILLSLGVFGTLTVEEVIKNGDTALAVAAIPALGQAGFTMMAIAAMLATSSSVNANLYGAGNMTSSMAAGGQFPSIFGGPSRVGGTRGMMITAALVLVMANAFDLSAIASLGSAIALGIFLLLCIAAFRLRHETGTNLAVIVLGALSTAVVLVVFAADLFVSDPRTFAVLIGFVLLAVVCDVIWSRIRASRVAAQSA